MRKLIFLLLLLLIATPVFAQQQEARMSLGVIGGGVPVATGAPCTGANPSDCTYRETFDGASSCYGEGPSNCNNTWVLEAGSPEFNYSTAPLAGTYSARFDVAAASRTSWALTGDDEYYVAFMFKWTTSPPSDANTFFNFFDSSYNTLCSLSWWFPTDVLFLSAFGGTDQFLTTSMVDGTLYYVKVRYKAGGGANAECQGWISTNGTTWTDTITSNDGTRTANTDRLQFKVLTGGVYLIDDVRVYTGNITW